MAIADGLTWPQSGESRVNRRLVAVGLTAPPGANEVPPNVLYWLRHGSRPWIVNVDLDYFFCEEAKPQSNDVAWFPMFSDAFIEMLFKEIKVAMDEGLVGVVTLCLTPTDFTAGWDECLKLSSRIFKILGATHPAL